MAATAVLVAALAVSCRTQATAQKDNGQSVAAKGDVQEAKVLHKVAANARTAQFITSKIKFKLKFGDKEVSLGGSLRMKKDDVIRLQLTAFGLVEAGRVEFTKDYVLVMDRINKQYIKADYRDVDFLRQSGLNFYSLQALFWNELFLPNRQHVDEESLSVYSVSLGSAVATIALNSGNMRYEWSAATADGYITAFSGSYSSGGTGKTVNGTGKTGVDWGYSSFRKMGTTQFPTSNTITITGTKKPVSVDLQLTNPNNDGDWETRTVVSSKYKQVSLDDIMRRLSAL